MPSSSRSVPRVRRWTGSSTSRGTGRARGVRPCWMHGNGMNFYYGAWGFLPPLWPGIGLAAWPTTGTATTRSVRAPGWPRATPSRRRRRRSTTTSAPPAGWASVGSRPRSSSGTATAGCSPPSTWPTTRDAGLVLVSAHLGRHADAQARASEKPACWPRTGWPSCRSRRTAWSTRAARRSSCSYPAGTTSSPPLVRRPREQPAGPARQRAADHLPRPVPARRLGGPEMYPAERFAEVGGGPSTSGSSPTATTSTPGRRTTSGPTCGRMAGRGPGMNLRPTEAPGAPAGTGGAGDRWRAKSAGGCVERLGTSGST